MAMPSMMVPHPFVATCKNFRYHGNMGRSGEGLNDIMKLADPEKPLLVQKSRNYL